MPDLARGDFRKAVLLDPPLPDFSDLMIRGEVGASEYAYPNGLLSQRIARWVVRKLRAVTGREATDG
jgi:hypothetical protein